VFVGISALLLFGQLILSENYFTQDTQLTTVESGFEKMNYVEFMRSPFFFIAVLYVLFDIELILLLPSVLRNFVSPIQRVRSLLLILTIITTLTLE
jgi:NADH:ubiquinone oxidoreductase subunit 3 (subunit A)